MIEPLEYASERGRARIDAVLGRRMALAEEHEATVRSILHDVRTNGDEAVVRYTRRFDAPDFSVEAIRVPAEDTKRAYDDVDGEFLASLGKAIKNVEDFHRRQLTQSWITTREDGVILGQVVRPVDSCGLYVPGGKGGLTPLVSSVLMNAIPAKIAGVPRVVLATPPNGTCGINPKLLVAAAECGVDEVYRMGSAWAIAALAYGTGTILPVDVIVGPGNIFVTLAKKLLSGMVGIDMIAGPSEVFIIAEEPADPVHLAADLLSQAEHDPLATSVLATTSRPLAERVAVETERLLAGLDRAPIARDALANNGVILVVRDLEQAIEIANRLAPEHLELVTRDPWGLLPRIRHAGAIFLGPHTPEPIGDYIAGPNHVLPTMGSARFSSALGVETFIKRSSVISYSEAAFRADAPDVIRLAEGEGLHAHALSIRTRMGEQSQ